MLQRAAAFETTERVYRVALNPERWRTLERIGQELGDETQLAEALAFLGEPADLDSATLPDLLRDPFRRKPFPSDRRFSNGEFGVLYTARTAQTAGYEYAHWAPRNFVPAPGEPVRVRLHLISATFHGRVKNVCPFVDEWLWLISDDYTECQKLGGSAHAEGLAALFAPSARHRPDGVTVPIFLIDAAADPKIEGDVLFIVTATEPTTFDIQIL
jgi:RES domain-containing protein